jgi:hypothetical protein
MAYFAGVKLPSISRRSLKHVQFPNTISIFGALLMGGFGLGLAWLALKNGSQKPGSNVRRNPHRDLDQLFSDISRGLGTLSSSRFGGLSLMRENQDEVERLLSELQRRLRMLEDGVREKYEERTHRILAKAARFGITLPPP